MRLLPVALCLLAVAPAAHAAERFRTPSGNIACLYGEGLLRCDIRQMTNQATAPRSCMLDWGDAFTLERRGRARRICHGDTVGFTGPLLRYGRTWRRNGIACVSRRRHLRCRNSDGRGFELSRSRQELF